MYRHVVLFRIHDEVTDDQVTAAIELLRSLGVLPGIVLWRVELSLDERKGRVIVEDSTFIDAAAFDAFRVDQRHTAAAETMAGIADWWVGDYAD